MNSGRKRWAQMNYSEDYERERSQKLLIRRLIRRPTKNRRRRKRSQSQSSSSSSAAPAVKMTTTTNTTNKNDDVERETNNDDVNEVDRASASDFEITMLVISNLHHQEDVRRII